MVRGRTEGPVGKAYRYGNLPLNESLSFFRWSLIEHSHGLAVLATILGVQLIITLSAILWHHMNSGGAAEKKS